MGTVAGYFMRINANAAGERDVLVCGDYFSAVEVRLADDGIQQARGKRLIG